VEAQIIVDVSVSYSGFTVTDGAFTDIADGTIYVPIGFKVGGATNYATDGSKTAAPYSSNTAAQTEAIIEKVIAGKSNLFSQSDSKVTGIFPAGTEINLSNLSIEMDWPKTHGTSDTAKQLNDIIGTYMASKGSKVVITYTITVQQNIQAST
jgi:hypothetical protein